MTEPSFETLKAIVDPRQPDPRDPRPEGTYRHPIFRDHNCWKCRDGALPCPSNYHGCEFPHARND